MEENLPYLMEQSQPKVCQADLKHLALLIGVETKDDPSADNVVKRTIYQHMKPTWAVNTRTGLIGHRIVIEYVLRENY